MVTQIPEGDTFDVLNAGTCSESDGIVWFPVQYHGHVGWVAESVGGDYLVVPAAGVTTLTEALGSAQAVVAARMSASEYALLNAELYPLASIIAPLGEPFPDLESGEEAVVRGGSLFVYTLDGDLFPAVVAFSASGDPRTFKQPARSGYLVGFMPSPDGSRVAWLFNLTSTPPTFDGCDAAAGCVGRVYELVISSADGTESTLAEWTVGEPYPYFQLQNWIDGRIVLERHMWGVASGYFPIMGGGLVSIDEATGAQTELTALTDGDDLLSPAGTLVARSHAADCLVELDYIEGLVCWTQLTDNDLSGYFTFSPSGRYLAYSVYRMDGAEIKATEVWFHDTELGETRVLASFPVAQPAVVAYVSAWLGDDLPVLTHDQTLSVIQISTEKSVVIDRVYVALGDEGRPVEGFVGRME